MNYPRWIRRTAILAGAVTLGSGTPDLLAQVPQSPEVQVIPASTKRCTCGRWTCPACQQRKLREVCPPGQVIPMMPNMAPGTMPMPMQPAPIYDSNGNMIPVPPSQSMPLQPYPSQPFPDSSIPNALPSQPSPEQPSPTTPTPDPTTEFNLNDATPALNTPLTQDESQSLASLGRPGQQSQSGFFGSNAGLTDPGLFGDFFGPTSNANSIISQNYETMAYGDLNGSVYDFDVMGPAINDISAAGVLNGTTVDLAQPASPNDLQRPAEPGYAFGGGTATLIGPGPATGSSDPFLLRYGYTKAISVPSSFAQQRMKLAENTSPIPQNRVFVNYSLFHNVPLENGITVNRISPGFETLLFSPNTSFEMRTPFATTLDSNILLDGGTNTSNVEFGNLYFSLKHVLWRRGNALVSGGLSMTVPTADSTRVLNGRGQEVVRIENESVHIMPFLGVFYKPSQRAFMQGVLQVDMDVNGNTVLQNNNLNQSSLTRIGRLQDMTLLYTDLGAGYWMYRSTGRGLTGVAPIAEVHYNRSLNKADCVVDPSGRTQIQFPIQQFDNVNLVSAMVFEFNQRNRLGLGIGVPVGNGSDRAFDGEFRATFNRYY